MNCQIGNDVSRAAQLLRSGKLVGFATETVYGLGANAFDERAVAGIFEAKERPTFDPLIVHLATIDQLPLVARSIPEAASLLIESYWPGPLTLIFPKTTAVPDLVTAGLDSVAVRIPSHPLALELLKVADVPIAAPSANRFGCVSPTTAEHVAEQLGDRIDYILDGGPCSVGLESTIVSLLGAQPTVLRLGGLDVEELEQTIGHVEMKIAGSDPGNRASESSPQLAPGMLLRHYAPRTPLVVKDSLSAPDLADGDALLLSRPVSFSVENHHCEILSMTGDLKECAAGFFSALRRLDALGPKRILAEWFPNEGLGRALNDRLRRAAATTSADSLHL
ncbi:MAG TPA: L-threonylcarbamoyladenylate synthase [Planctomycetaceae bacterium]|nr:L-threonylcarbamoyladenylate synthase [Planctomycetaceae bacterium]